MKMTKEIILDALEQKIEDNFGSLQHTNNMDQEIELLKEAACRHIKKNKSITLRINEMDLEAIKIRASKSGLPYQTYITMLIHKDAASSL